MKKFILILGLLITQLSFAQNKELTSGDEYYNSILIKYKNEFKRESKLRNFASEMVKNRAYAVQYAGLITDWPEGTAYLEKVIKNITPENDTNNIPLKVYISGSSEINAFALEDGIIVINAGLLANVNSESELIGVLGHEIGHYALQHALRSYRNLKSSQIKHDLAVVLTTVAPIAGMAAQVVTTAGYFRKSRTDETEADDFSLKLINQSQYSNQGFLSAMKLFIALDAKQNSLKKKDKQGFYLFSTHPTNENRLKKIQNFIADNPEANKKIKPENTDAFNNIKKKALQIAINDHMARFGFDDALDLAFRSYLLDPDNVTISELLVEALRKKIAFRPLSNNEIFISDVYDFKRYSNDLNTPYLDFQEGDNTTKINLFKSIHYHLFESALMMDSSYLGIIKAKEILNLDTIEFVTNKQALEYFIKKSKQLNSKRICFSEVLMNTIPEKKNGLVQEFITNNPGDAYNDFLSAFAKDELASFKTNDTLILYFDYTILNDNKMITNDIINEDKSEFERSAKKIEAAVLALNKPNLRYVRMPYMTEYQRKNLIDLYSLAGQMISIDAVNNKPVYFSSTIDLLKIKPELWYFFKKEQVKHIYMYYYSFSGSDFFHDIISINFRNENSTIRFGRYSLIDKYNSIVSFGVTGSGDITKVAETNLKDLFTK